MKKPILTFALCLCAISIVSAASRYWVGPYNGSWTNSNNWSATNGGAGGAGIPASEDAVIFPSSALVNVNASTTVTSLSVSTFVNNVTLFTATGSTITILNSFSIGLGSTLQDSTSEDVPFNVVLNGATSATGSIAGRWIFSGRVPVSEGKGAWFTAQQGSKLSVYSPLRPLGDEPPKGAIMFRNNTGHIVSSAATLEFSNNSIYILENNMEAFIPDATWADHLFDGPDYSGFLSDDAPEIVITGNMGRLKHAQSAPLYARFTVDLGSLAADASLALPNGTRFKGDVKISNTNNHTLTLLADTSATSNVSVLIGSQSNAYYIGSLLISGATTKVALATAPPGAPGTNYRLQVKYNYEQTGGNFSLQDYNNATRSSTLAIQHDLLQTGGSFITNSTATGNGAAFAVEMNGPLFISDASGTHDLGQEIQMSAGTIDNGRNMVALRVSGIPFSHVELLAPLQTGRIELLKGTVITTAANILTVTDPSASAVVTGTGGTNFIDGPLRRVGLSTNPLVFPTGKDAAGIHLCTVIPATAAPSVYQAEYFNAAYSDLNVIAPLKGVSKTGYWEVVKVAGSDASVQLTLTEAVSGASFTDGIVVAHYVNGHWISERGTFIKPGTSATGSVVSKTLSVFSPFTIGYEDIIEAPLPVYLLTFDGARVNTGARLSWQVAELPARFEVLRSDDGRSFTQAGVVEAVQGRQDYAFLDNRLKAGNNYYRLRSIQKDGSASLSRVVAIINRELGIEITSLAPTLVTGKATLSVSAARAGEMQLLVTDMAGRSMQKIRISAGSGTSAHTLNLSGLPSGAYYLTGYLNGESTSVIRFVRQ